MNRATAAAEIRVATLDDLPMLQRALPMNTPTRHRECLEQQGDGRIIYVVAWRGADPVGHGLIHWPGPRNADVAAHLAGCPEIFNLGVREDVRSQGIGRLLLGRLEEMALARGEARVGLGVALANRRARDLYHRLGYRECGAPQYTDRWFWIDRSGVEHVEEDACVFLVKPLA